MLQWQVCSPNLNLTWNGQKEKKMVVRCACFLWLPPHTPSCFSFLSTDMFWLPLFSWQLWVPTISSHTAYHLLHFTDCGCSKAKFTPQPYKPTLLFSVSGDSSCSAAPALFFFNIYLGSSNKLWVFGIVTEYAMKWRCHFEAVWSCSNTKPHVSCPFLSVQLLLLNSSVKDYYSYPGMHERVHAPLDQSMWCTETYMSRFLFFLTLPNTAATLFVWLDFLLDLCAFSLFLFFYY